jgi:nucleoside-diphosphate-sugar epimerase
VADSVAGKTVLVTGATGFLGGALTQRLASEGARVRALARRPEKGEFLRILNDVELVKGDIINPEPIVEIMNGCDIVFHAAASMAGSFKRQYITNVESTRKIGQVAIRAKVKRFVHVSTIAVYAYRVHGEVGEDTPFNPGDDPYNITKAEAENRLKEIASKDGLAYSIIRPGMIYGPRSNMWTRTMFNLAKRCPTPFVGSGQGSAFPIYVDDVVDMMLVLATHPSAVGEAFHCTPDPSPTWREFLSAYSRLAGHNRWLPIPPLLVKMCASIVGLIARPQTQAKALPDMVSLSQRQVTFKMTKARDLLGWQPTVDLPTGVQRCAPWLRDKGLLD